MALRVGMILPARSTKPSVTTGATSSGMPSARDTACEALRAVTKGQKRNRDCSGLILATEQRLNQMLF